MMYRLFFGLVLVAVFSLKSTSQNPWSLSDCIQYALEHNIQIKQQELTSEISAISLTQSKMSVLPDLNAGATHVYNFGQTIDPYTNTFAQNRVLSNNFYLVSRVTIFNGFQVLNTIKKSAIDLQASKYDVQKMKDDVALNIATAYLQILFNMENFETTKNQRDMAVQQVERTNKLVQAGTLPKGDLLTLESQLSLEELNVVNAQNQLDLSILNMKHMLDLPHDTVFEVQKPKNLEITDETSLLYNSDSIYLEALQTQPMIKSAELTVESSEKDIQISKGKYYPNLYVQGSIGTGYSGASKEPTDYQPVPFGYTSAFDTVYTLSPTEYQQTSFNDQVDDNFNQSVGLYLNIPIFTRFQTRASVSRARINSEMAEKQLQLEKNNLNKTIEQAYTDAKAALKKYHASRKSVQALKESFTYTEQKFNVGMVNTVDYNDAKNKLAKANSDMLQAKYEYFFRLKILDFYLGKPLSL